MAEQWSRASTEDGQTFVFADDGAGPLVVLLNGFPDTPRGWDRIAGALSDAGYRAVRPWLRGYHPETVVEGRPYDALTIARDPIALLDALGEREAILVGHDWGAGMVYGTATLAPDRVRAIVPIAIPHPTLLPRGPSLLWVGRHFILHKMPWAEWVARRRDFRYIDTLYRRWAPDWHGPERDRCVADAKATFADPRSLSGALDYYRALSPRTAPELTTPPDVLGLVVGGTTDGIGREPFERTADAMGEGSEALVVDGAGHWPHREAEDRFIESLLEFCGRVPASAAAA